MAVRPIEDVAISQLCLDVKTSESPIMFFNVQALLAVLYRSVTYVVGVPVLFACRRTQQESAASEPPDSRAQHVCTAISGMHDLPVI